MEFLRMEEDPMSPSIPKITIPVPEEETTNSEEWREHSFASDCRVIQGVKHLILKDPSPQINVFMEWKHLYRNINSRKWKT